MQPRAAYINSISESDERMMQCFVSPRISVSFPLLRSALLDAILRPLWVDSVLGSASSQSLHVLTVTIASHPDKVLLAAPRTDRVERGWRDLIRHRDAW